MFWIQGKPGSGKSVLMDYLGKADRVSQLLNTSLGPQWIRIWFFFDFRANQSIANSFEGLLRSLLLQVLGVVPGMEPELRQFSNKTHVVGNVPEWNKRTLQEAFYKALANVPSRLYIFADGLDEYSGNMHELLAFFQGLSNKTGIRGRLKICLASRPEPFIDLALNAYPGFRMQDQNLKGIEQYVSRTVLGLRVAAMDKQRLEQLCADIAKKAEGVFLWARFAVSEVIGSYAEGDSPNEMKHRLDELPSDMGGIYARIFSRMSTNDRHEAQLIFQLVCFARGSMDGNNLTILQLKEAVAVAKNCTADSTHEYGVDSLERFRKRVRAKCGGLLEEVPRIRKKLRKEKIARTRKIRGKGEGGQGDRKEDGQDCGGEEEEDYDDPKGWNIKLIHLTVESYLEREGWLLGWQIGDQHFASPHALWLNICCRCIQSMLGTTASRLRYTKPSMLRSRWSLVPSLRHSLVKYTSLYLFDHARCMEQQYQESSYCYLSLFTPELWRHLQENYRKPRFMTKRGAPDVDWDAVDEESDKQPWRIVVEQGLALCCGDLVTRNLYKPFVDGQDISLAIHTISPGQFAPDSDLEEIFQLIRFFIKSGSIVSQRNILECLYRGTASILKLLLDTLPKGAIQLNRENLFVSYHSNDVRDDTYDGETVGPLWELARSMPPMHQFEPMLDLLLARGERLDQRCRPGGTMLHALVIHILFYEDFFRGIMDVVKVLIERGADVSVRIFRIKSFLTSVSIRFARYMSKDNCGLSLAPNFRLQVPNEGGMLTPKLNKAPGPRGTPLQFAWRCFHSPRKFLGSRRQLQRLMTLLMDSGADTDWTEPDGSIVNRATISAWCAWSEKQLQCQSEFDYAFCEVSWYNYEYPLYVG